MTLYLLTIPHDTADEPTMKSMRETDPEELETALAQVAALNDELTKANALRFAGGLHPPSTAKTVDPTGGVTRVLDEPFVVADQYVGGFWIIEVADDDAALDWTTRIAEAMGSRVELRAFQEVE